MATPTKTPTICLNMIVKNESSVITRLMESVVGVIDYYVICDTGSTDDTKSIIGAFFAAAGIPGVILDVPFKNFGYNRTIALERARATYTADYLLFLDADMKLVVEPKFNKGALTAKAYQLLQKNSAISWWNIRMIHKSVGVQCVGPTHEYYDMKDGVEGMNLPELWIDDVGDGGCKGDKFDRDVRLLKEGLEESPDNARYLFYLANSYFNSNRTEESVPYYEKRIAVGGWYEEIWYSYYNLGLVYARLGKPELAISKWLAGYEVCKTRSENIYEITKYYRVKGSHVLADLFCTLGLSIGYPKNEKLFIIDAVYDWMFDYEMSIIGYYTKAKSLDLRSSRVLAKTTEFCNNVLSNYKFYAKQILPLAMYKTTHTFTEIVELNGQENTTRSCNPCVFKHDGAYYMNIRMVNYEIYKDGAYSVQSKIATCNKFIQLDSETFKRVRNTEVLYVPADFGNYYVGYEDIKVSHDAAGNLIFVGTTQGLVGGRILLTMHKGAYPMSAGGTLFAKPIATPNSRECEKNWAMIDGTDKVVYEWHPLTIGHVAESGDAPLMLAVDATYDTPVFFNMVRGSSNGCVLDGEVWFLCHLVDHDKPRFYYHCFVVLDAASLKLKRWSTLFTFEGERIEFCIGLIVERNRIIISHSTWDRTAIVGVYDKEKLLNTLEFLYV